MSYLSPSELVLLAFSLPRHVSHVMQLESNFEARTGRKLVVIQGTRTTAQQAQIYADSLKAGAYKGTQGYRAAPPGLSKHQVGAATDLKIVGQEQKDATTDAKDPLYIAMADEARKLGMKPGLDFKTGLPDPYHVEEPEDLASLAQEFSQHKAVMTATLSALAVIVVIIVGFLALPAMGKVA